MGMGMVPVFKSDVSAFYDRLQASESGVGPIDRFYASSFPTRFTAQIRGFTSEGYIDAKNDKRLHDCIRYYIVSGRKALEDTGLSNGSDAHTKVSLCVRVCAPARHRWFIISRILRCTKTLYAMFPEKKETMYALQSTSVNNRYGISTHVFRIQLTPLVSLTPYD
jgi:hypothetical protein